MWRIAQLALISVFVLGLAAPAVAAECEGVSYPDTIEVNGTQLSLNGLGVREATVFSVNVYVAALYLETTSTSGSEILRSSQTSRLILRFVRNVDREDIVEAWNEGFENNAGRALSGLRDRIDQLNGWMSDARDGGSFTFTYIPATGLEVKVDNEVRGTIEGEDFARAFLSIWLGSHPPNSGLKTGLLGGECG